MKKTTNIFNIFLLFLVLVGCNSVQQIQSRPEGYAIISTDYAAKGSFLYNSETPFNIDEVELSLYLLPNLWGEIKSEQVVTLLDNNPSFVIFEDNSGVSMIRRAFVKYINIQYDVWTAYNVDDNIIYKNASGIDFHEYLEQEDNVKEYIEAINGGTAYFLDNERVMLVGYQSIFDDDTSNYQFQETILVNINYTETLKSMPDLSSHFEDFESSGLTILFMRTFEHRNDAEFQTAVFKN